MNGCCRKVIFSGGCGWCWCQWVVLLDGGTFTGSPLNSSSPSSQKKNEQKFKCHCKNVLVKGYRYKYRYRYRYGCGYRYGDTYWQMENNVEK